MISHVNGRTREQVDSEIQGFHLSLRARSIPLTEKLFLANAIAFYADRCELNLAAKTSLLRTLDRL
jgi:hypothetical protein